MYKNIYYDRYKKLIHLWTDSGYKTFEFEKYGYLPSSDSNSKFKTIYGEAVKKEYIGRYDNESMFYESDVISEVRTLVDLYHEDDSTPDDLKIIGLDIEVTRSREKGYARPPEVFNAINAITLTDFSNNKQYTLVLDPKGEYKNTNGYDFVETFNFETGLLRRFYELWKNLSPDIVTGWNIEYYDMPYIYLRTCSIMGEKIAERLSPIGKIYYKDVNYEKGIFNPSISIAGISQLDYLTLYKNYTFKNQPSYKLSYIATKELEESKIEYEGDLQQLWEEDIDKFVKYNVVDVDLIQKFENKLGFIDLHVTLSHLAHVPYEFALSSVRLIEGKVLTETKKRNLVCPNVKDIGEADDSKIVGAFVKKSRKGLYEYLFDLDLTSLYPMIIATLNISSETKVGKIKNYIDTWMDNLDRVHYEINVPIFDENRKKPEYDKEINAIIEDDRRKKRIKVKTIGDLYNYINKHNYSLSCNGILYDKSKIGLIPEIILEIFNTRQEYKGMRKEFEKKGDHDKANYYDSMQMCYKILINSIYGVLCNKYFRLFDKDNAQSITLTGQYTNKSAMDSVYKLHEVFKKELGDTTVRNLDDKMKELFDDPIITGDTDSVILSAVPTLYYMYGEGWKEKSEDELLDEVIGISKKMSGVANKRSVEFSAYFLNSDKNYLEFKEEWVARTGFYIGVKKRYANWIKRQEGIEKNYVDVKGLDIIRSSFPTHLQNFMEKVLHMILYMEDKDDIYDYIKEVRGDLVKVDYKENIMYISVISSANKLWKYLNKNGYKKGTPFHIKGVSNYNNLLKYKELNNMYPEIYEGDRIGVVYLNNNPYNFDMISYPYDKIPPKIDQFLKEFVDQDYSVDKLLDNKLNTFYDAMDWQPPNVKYNDLSDIFV